MTKKVAVILSGCGVYDGAEIHESVITLLRLDQRGAKVQCFAPNIAQHHVINHTTGEEMPESRNVLVESARIARGEIRDVRELAAADFDALIIPGGFGAAKNLSDFAISGANCTVQPDVLAAARGFAEAGKPVRMHVPPHTTPKEAAAAAEAMAKGASAASGVKVSTKLGDCDLARPETCSSGERWLTKLLDKAESMTFEQWKSRSRALAPYAMLAMQPIFAALLLATFAGSGRRYAEHFVFSLHSHSVWFLALLLAMATGLEGLMTFAVFGHSLAAMRRVYGLSWWGAAWRGVLLSGFYFVLLGAVALTLVALIAATA